MNGSLFIMGLNMNPPNYIDIDTELPSYAKATEKNINFKRIFITSGILTCVMVFIIFIFLTDFSKNNWAVTNSIILSILNFIICIAFPLAFYNNDIAFVVCVLSIFPWIGFEISFFTHDFKNLQYSWDLILWIILSQSLTVIVIIGLSIWLLCQTYKWTFITN